MNQESYIQRGVAHAKRIIHAGRVWAERGYGYCTYSQWNDVSCVFVLSTGRTGTETLAHLLDLAGEVRAFHEPHPQLMVERKEARVEVYDAPRKYKRIFRWSRGDALLRAHRASMMYAETSARLTFFAPVIAALLPNAKFIYMHRHPGAIIRSGMRRGWYDGHPADFARIEPTPAEVPPSRWQVWQPFEKICWYWNVYNRFAIDFEEEIDSSRILRVRAPDLYEGRAVPDIFRFLGIPVPAQMQIDAILKRKHNAQRKAFFPKYEHWTTQMKEVLANRAGQIAERLGYKLEGESLSC